MSLRTVFASVQTTDATKTTLWSDPDGPRRAAYRVHVLAYDIDGGVFGDGASFVLHAVENSTSEFGWLLASQNMGTAAKNGAAAWTVEIEQDGTTEEVEVNVTGEASHTIEWRAAIEILTP